MHALFFSFSRRMWTFFVLFTPLFHFGPCFGSGINSCPTNNYDLSRNVIDSFPKLNNDGRRLDKHKRCCKRNFHPNMIFVVRGGFTDENRMQTQLRPLNHIENEIHDRALYWKWREHEQKKDIDLQNHHYVKNNYSQIHPYNDTFTLNDKEMKMIQNISQSLDFYLTHGIHNILHVPYSHTQRRRSIFRKFHKETNTLKLNCRSFLHSSTNKSPPTVIVLTGWADSHVKYSTLLHRLYKEGYNVHTYDHRCQGLSESLHKANRQIIDMPNFNDYVDDLRLFYKNIVIPTLSSTNEKVSIIAHSMGCLIALKAQAKQSDPFLNKMILMCPMLQPMTPININLTYYMSRIITMFGFGTKTATGKTQRGPWLPSKGITHCSIKRSYWEILRKNIPDIIAASPSFRFMREIIRTSNQFRQSIPDVLVQTPMLVLTVGEDSYVNTNATIKTIQKMKDKKAKQTSKDASIVSKSQEFIPIQEIHYPKAYHDIISEDSTYMIPNAIDKIVKYLNESV